MYLFVAILCYMKTVKHLLRRSTLEISFYSSRFLFDRIDYIYLVERFEYTIVLC